MSKLTWQDLAAAAGVLFGIISTIAYLDQRRSSKNQSVLLEVAKRHVSKEISEETIKQLDDQKKSLELEVSQRIPYLARQAVLKEQAQLHAKAAAQHFTAWRQITGELESTVNIEGMDPLFVSVIVDKLLPKYERDQEIELLRNRITGLSVVLALISTLFPYPLNVVVSIAVAAPLLMSLIRFMKLQQDPRVEGAYTWGIAIGIYFSFFIIAGGTSTLLFMIGDGITEEGKILRIVLAILFLVGVAGLWPYLRFINRRYKHKAVSRDA
jgi:hypothetical protein